jgi:hypothetical protein
VVGANWSVDKYYPWLGYGYSSIYAKGGVLPASAESFYGNEIVYADLPVATV